MITDEVKTRNNPAIIVMPILATFDDSMMGKSSRKTLAMVGFTGMLASWAIAVIFLNTIISNLFYLLAILAISSIFGEIAGNAIKFLALSFMGIAIIVGFAFSDKLYWNFFQCFL